MLHTIFKTKYCPKSQVGDLCWAYLKHHWLLLENPHSVRAGKKTSLTLYRTRENMSLPGKWKGFCLPFLEIFLYEFKKFIQMSEDFKFWKYN